MPQQAPVLDLAALAGRIADRGARVVAIDGRGGAGKSTLARQLARQLPGAVVVAIDDFHRPAAQRASRPVGHGADYDLERLAAQVLEPLAAGRPARYQRYDWEQDRLAEWRELPQGARVLLEGVYASCERLRGYSDYAIWIECPYEVRLRRGVERDGETMRGVWVARWMPAEDRYVEAHAPRRRADLVLDGSGLDGACFRVVAGATP